MPRAPKPALIQRAREIEERLARAYPDAACALLHANPLQLLVATILSAQCTDARVNLVTPGLFKRYPDARAFAAAALPELENAIHSTGFFRNKARSLKEACRDIVSRHGGNVPGTLEELTALRGVGRKTANVVLGNAFGVPGVVVDTHAGRVSRRLGLAKQTDPEKAERELMALFPPRRWTALSHELILHGRKYCRAPVPRCTGCPLLELCPYPKKSFR